LALRQYLRNAQGALVINVDLPDYSGWLLVAKLRLTHPSVPVWLYGARPTPHDVKQARFVGANSFLPVGSDDCERLADEIFAKVTRRNRKRCSA
jgi:hypothetical protein